ncbi:Calx-beta domain-containing protein [Catalinimonas niigatensis]|uniref:Calx-beta domain-containing protein n=1 Tax=Catalinimonas niigatensis TaxID=1397264 RepID=UPI002665EA24|nr:Calx-beta domain-containing protein [Catalinimonas niigatensis]WPP51290.1 Calx-beta domain-containing protein [Catalinimonas niigatensis]
MEYLLKANLNRLLSIGITSLLVLSACKEEDVAVGDPSIVSFALAQDASKEGDGIVKVLINLDKAQNTETVIHFKVDGNATAFSSIPTQADYELLSDSPLVIKKGETSTAIEIKLIEDHDFEQQFENLILSLDGILEGNAILSSDFRKLTHVHEIEENDYLLFLEWESEQEVDLNMFIEMPNKSLLSANSERGFEEITMINVKDQEQYFVDIWYNSGESQVSYQLKSLNAGEKEKKILVDGIFSTDLTSKNSSSIPDQSYQDFLMIKKGRELIVLK